LIPSHRAGSGADRASRLPDAGGVRAATLLLAALLLPAFASPARAQLLSRFEIRTSVISPDGDGLQDSTRVEYALADTALTLSVIVFAADSITPVDTLRAPAFDVPAGTRTLVWKGLRWDGSAAPEGAYVVTLDAVGDDDPDERRSLPVFIDTTPPTLQIVSVVPDPYGPGVVTAPAALSISFVVTNASPAAVGRPSDELRSAFVNPSGQPVTPSSLTITPPFTGASGSYVMAWNASSELTTLGDGQYRVTLTLADVAGYASTSSHSFDIDVKAPEVKATSLSENASMRVPPDSLRGFAYDVRGIDSLSVRYATTRPYLPVPSAAQDGDSLHFAVPLADSIAGEGSHRVYFRAVDNVGRITAYEFPLTIDLTAPATPTLVPFEGRWHASTYPLAGEFDDGGDTRAYVRILRNGAAVDSVSAILADSTFTRTVSLVAGRNELAAVLRDGAFNASAPSNTVVVTFDDGSGLFAPTPFVPGASFSVNAASPARGAALRVFDVTGDLVVRFEDPQPRQFYAFPWDGRNGSGVAVKKGPLVAVAAIDYEDGTHQVVRRVILFDPDGR
jgi:hypothetical protein